MFFLLLAAVATLVGAQQYTLSIYLNNQCSGSPMIFLAESACRGFTDPTDVQWSWQTQTQTEAGIVPLSVCESTLTCGGNCVIFTARFGRCFTWSAEVSATIEAGAPPSTTEGELTTHTTTTTTVATTAPPGSTKSPGNGGGGGGLCFHQDTLITHGDATLTMAEPGPCRVPHVVREKGVIVSVAAGHELRLTSAHLLYTQRGLVAAGDLSPGRDTLYGDLAQSVELHVLNVEPEKELQTYYGLNCPHGSTVLANGIKASTFDTLHTLPALWMRAVSAVVGIDRASAWGHALAALGQRLGVV